MRSLFFGTLGLAVFLSGCAGQSSSSSVPPQGLQSEARSLASTGHPDLTCAPGKNSCLYFKPSSVKNPGPSGTAGSTMYTTPASDTTTPTLVHMGATCRGHLWHYAASIDPNYTEGPDGNSLLWAVTVSLVQKGKNPGSPAPGSTCVMEFGSPVGHGDLLVNTPS